MSQNIKQYLVAYYIVLFHSIKQNSFTELDRGTIPILEM